MMTRTEIAVLPGGLNAALYKHELAIAEQALPCWTIVTEGLAPYGQSEIVLTVLKARGARDEFPPGVLGYIRSLKQLAEQGSFVGDGGISSWRAPGPLGFGGFVGVAFFLPTPIPGIRLRDDYLEGVFLKEGEVEVATRCSLQRVLNALGRQARYFPFPYWSDPGRAAVYGLGDAGRSVLYNLDRIAMPGATATVSQQGDACLLSVPRDGAELLAETLESRRAVAVLPGRDPGLPAALVWNPQQAAPEANAVAGKDASDLSAAFVSLVASDEPVDRVTFLEDGYGVLLSPDTAARLLALLRSGEANELVVAEAQRVLTVRVPPEA
jgi:hypothetical protein